MTTVADRRLAVARIRRAAFQAYRKAGYNMRDAQAAAEKAVRAAQRQAS